MHKVVLRVMLRDFPGGAAFYATVPIETIKDPYQYLRDFVTSVSEMDPSDVVILPEESDGGAILAIEPRHFAGAWIAEVTDE